MSEAWPWWMLYLGEIVGRMQATCTLRIPRVTCIVASLQSAGYSVRRSFKLPVAQQAAGDP